MYKNCLILLGILSSLHLSAQTYQLQDDFEGPTGISTWAGDDCGMDDSFANPFVEGINTSATVLKYTDTGGTYANVRFDASPNIDLSTHANFSVMLYVPSSGLTGNQPNQISLKLQDGTLGEPWVTQSEIIKPIELDKWQVVNFDFANDSYQNLDPGSPPPLTRSDFSRVVFQINGENNQDQVVAYLDNFSLNDSTAEPGPDYSRLVWSDEFNGNGAIDNTKWFHQTQLPNGTSWYNGELQHYTNRIENSYLDSGHLHIMAIRESFSDQGETKQYTSARLNSKFAFTYGRVEVRAKLPFGEGTWPAIWMLGKNITEPGAFWTNQFGTTPWPACGEIDIMEHWGYNQNFVQSAMHTPSSHGATVNKGGLYATDVSNTFHVYALEWTPEYMKFSLDGAVYYTYEPSVYNADTWPFDAEQYFILNVAMQGTVAANFTQSPMVIDYIRVYQESLTKNDPNLEELGIKVYPSPVEDILQIDIPNGQLGKELKLYNTKGQLVKTIVPTSKRTKVDVSAVRRGIYFLTLEVDQQQYSYKILKK
ncbi:MAG: family 16 glycosylhydrolase [Bacteroidota bacterium]